ncbi:hypothetical protein JL722_3930 [Aureococcus anophagefferens]|nr:hypothetical protein JL722_3930 [Aureococcus anophagefferens]
MAKLSTGKSSALAALAASGKIDGLLGGDGAWPADKAIISAVADAHGGDAARAIDRLSSVGLNTLPTWRALRRALQRPAVARGRRAGPRVAPRLGRLRGDGRRAQRELLRRRPRAPRAPRGLRGRGLATTRASVATWAGADWALLLGGAPRLVVNPGESLRRPATTVRLDEAETDEAFHRARPRADAEALYASKSVTSASIFGGGAAATLSSTVVLDAATEAASAAFEVDFDGKAAFQVPRVPPLPKHWRVGLLTGPSGSGKSTLLATLAGGARRGADVVAAGADAPWPSDAAVAAVVDGDLLADFGVGALARARPYETLSRGERELADLARLCGADGLPSPFPLDEFTSRLDRAAARKCANALRRWWRGGPQLVVATVHGDLVDALRPDWAFDAASGSLAAYAWPADLPDAPPPAAAAVDDAALFAPPRVDLVLRRTHRVGESTRHRLALWDAFKAHHYMSGELNAAAATGVRYISRTAHPRFGAYRESSPLWKPTLSNRSVMGVVVHCESARVALREKLCEKHGVATDAEAKRLEEALVKKKGRVSFSHEYVGDDAAQAAALRAVQAKQAEGDGLDAWLGGRAPAKRAAPAPKPRRRRSAQGRGQAPRRQVGQRAHVLARAAARDARAKSAAAGAAAATPAATAAAPAPPPPPPPPTGSGRGQFRAAAAPKPPSSRPAYSKKGDATAIRLKQSNPKRRGTKSHERYDKYKAATTKGEYRALGGSSADYSFDLKHKYITEL